MIEASESICLSTGFTKTLCLTRKYVVVSITSGASLCVYDFSLINNVLKFSFLNLFSN